VLLLAAELTGLEGCGRQIRLREAPSSLGLSLSTSRSPSKLPEALSNDKKISTCVQFILLSSINAISANIKQRVF
jgi:hypothetical protein